MSKTVELCDKIVRKTICQNFALFTDHMSYAILIKRAGIGFDLRANPCNPFDLQDELK